jgi:hypothetical protein
MSPLPAIPGLLLAGLLLLAGVSGTRADDRFSMAFGSRDLLVVLGPNGERKAQLPLPSISQSVAVGETMFQVSYGRDANNLLTAIIAPDPSQPQDLHFTVLGKSIDSDKQAVVTLTFSKNQNSVSIDPGYVGVVEVNSHKLRPDSAQNAPLMPPLRTPIPNVKSVLTDASSSGASATVATTIAPPPAAPAPPPSAEATPITPAPVASSSAPATTKAAATPPVKGPVPDLIPPVAANAQSVLTSPAEATENHVSDHAPDPMQVNNANQMPFTASATPGPSTVSVQGSAVAPKQHPLFWAEPITPPGGNAPSVGVNEMKLIQLRGAVTVQMPGSDRRDAQEGMIIPSGSTISTSDGGSVAVFMGGVNSIRLIPNSEVQITQQLDGSLRKTVINLHDGTVFSRVGHRPGEIQNYQVATPEGVAVAKGTIVADSRTNGHHYAYCVKGIYEMLINGVTVGTLTALPNNVASGAMPAAADGNKVLFAALTVLQNSQTYLPRIIDHINAGTASQPELAYYNDLKNTFNVMVDDVYDPTHPNAFLGAFTSTTGFGDSTHSSIERPQDFANPNPNNLLGNGLVQPSLASALPASLQASAAAPQPFLTPAVDVGAVPLQ